MLFAELRQKLREKLRRSYPNSQGIMELKPQHIYILPTGYGLVFAAILLLMLIGSMNYISNLGYLLTFLLAGMGLVAMVHTWRNLLKLQILGGKVLPVFAGQEASFEITLINPEMRNRFAIRLISAYEAEATADVLAEDKTSVTIHFPTFERGRLPLKRITLNTVYPLGMFRAWSYIDPNMICTVYPTPAKSGLPKEQQVWSDHEGGDQGKGSDDFVGLRPYRQGDSPKHIDWKAFARERGMVSKQFGGNQAERLVLDWDLLQGYDKEQKLSLLCRFVLIAEERKQKYSLKLPGIHIAENSGEQHKHQCLATLATFEKEALL